MNIDERAVVQRILKGETKAFEEIVHAYEKKVYNTALKMCRNADDAQDISQEVFLKLYSSLGAFKGESSLSTYIYRITSNLCIDYLRKHSNAKEISLYGISEEGDEYEIEIPDDAPSPLERMERGELGRAIRCAIGELSDISRQIIILREIDGLSYREIADVTGAEEGTVKSRLVRARRALCKILTEKGNIPEKLQSKYIENTDCGKEVL